MCSELEPYAFGVIDQIFHLVGVTLVKREHQNDQPRKADAKASNNGGCLGFVSDVAVGSPVSK
jgi:hypothetical protein